MPYIGHMDFRTVGILPPIVLIYPLGGRIYRAAIIVYISRGLSILMQCDLIILVVLALSSLAKAMDWDGL